MCDIQTYMNCNCIVKQSKKTFHHTKDEKAAEIFCELENIQQLSLAITIVAFKLYSM